MRSEGYSSRSVCLCVCVQAAHLRLTQLNDKLDVLTDLVAPESIWRFSYNGFVAIAFPYLRVLTTSAIFIRETGSFSAFLPYIILCS